MKTIGKIGSIILTPLHFLYELWLNFSSIIAGILPILYCMFVIYDIYCLYLAYHEETLGNFIFSVVLNVIALGVIGAVTLIVNTILCKLLSLILATIEVAYEQCIAWRDGISMDELEGRLAYKEAKRNNLIKAKEEKKKAKVEEEQRKKEEAYQKGYTDAYAKDTTNSESFRKQAENQSKQKSQTQTDSTQKESFKDQQHRQQQAYEEQRWKAYEEQQRRQQEQQNSQRFHTAYDDKLEQALTILHLKKGCSFEEVKNNYRMLAKMFHPDSGNSKFDTNDAQLKINEAYEFLKSYYDQK